MLELWSPFQRKNNPVTVSQLQYKDIKGLEKLELDEGFRISYKIDFESAKEDLGKYISSFANTDGGWIFFGVDKEPVKIVNMPKEKKDYNQIITTLLKSQCGDNIPQFETKFVKDPKDSSVGVLALYCYKDVNPPYLYKGKVYTRNGSSSEPEEINSRLLLDNLYKRKEFYDKDFEEFCVRSVFVPTFGRNNYEAKQHIPMLNIYIKLNSFNFIGKYLKDIKNIAETYVSENSGFNYYTISMNSIVFQNSLVDFAAGNSTCTAELFFDGSLKVHMPLLIRNQNYKRDIINKLPKNLYDYNLYKIFEGQETSSIVHTILNYYFNFLNKKKILINNSKIKIDYTDIENSIMVFDNKKFYTKLKTEPLRINFKQQQSSKYELDELLHGINRKDWVNFIVSEFLFMAFGYMPFEKIDVLKLEEIDKENY
ncbi:MAG: ATP-binding protein [Clostridia bacterium]|nr:ATP-binding protein [Clostridia bacterium]